MTYPVLPLVSYYGDAIEFDSRPNLVEQGRGGVKDRSYRHWKNRTKRSFTINATIQNRDELKDFLENNRGTPFRFSFDGTGESVGLFVCKSWNWNWLVYVAGSGGVWKLTMKLEEVFRPNFPPTQVGTGNLILSLQLSGLGNVDVNIGTTGLGELQTQPFVLSSSGIVFGDRIGSGNLLIPTITLSGSGVINKLLLGSGNLGLGAIALNSVGGYSNVAEGVLNTHAIELFGEGFSGIPYRSEGSNLETQAIDVSGSGSIFMEGQGAIVLPTADVVGDGRLIATGSGVMVTNNPVVAGSGTATGSAPTLDTTGLQAWYSFNDDIISDVSGNDRGWTIVDGSDIALTANGKVGNGVEKTSTSTSSYLQQDSARTEAFFNTQWYVSFWMKRSENTAASFDRVPIDAGQDSASGRWGIYWFSGGTFRYQIRKASGASNITTPITTNDELMLVELYYNASTEEFGIAFDNGTFTTATFAGAFNAVTTDFQLFRRVAGFGRQYQGVLDELTIWSTMPASFAPTDPRREYLWNGGAGNTYPT